MALCCFACQAWSVNGNKNTDLWYNCLTNHDGYHCKPASNEGSSALPFKHTTCCSWIVSGIKLNVWFASFLSSRLDPGGAGPHDPVPALLLLLPDCVRVSALQTGQGRTLLLYRHLPGLGEWVWLQHFLTGHTLWSFFGCGSEIIPICLGFLQTLLTFRRVSPRFVRDVRGDHLHRDDST